MENAILSAITARHGVKIYAPNQEAAKAEFYKVRKDMLARGIALAAFVSCHVPPNQPNQLWLVKKAQANAEGN